MQKALGIIETYGLLAGITVADTMVKAADVELIGYELARGQGMTVIKIQGDVGAVKAAIASGEAVARELDLFCAKDIIPRPAANLDTMVFNSRTVGQVPPPGPESYNHAGKAARPLPPSPIEEPPVAEPPVAEPSSEEQPAVESLTETPTETSTEDPIGAPTGGSCNLCNDPACPRKARQPHKLCIHYLQEEK